MEFNSGFKGLIRRAFQFKLW